MVARFLQLVISMLVLSSLTLAQDPQKPDTPPPASKSISNGLMERVFGGDGAELKYPQRVSFMEIGLLAAFHEVNITEDGRVELIGPVSIGLTQNGATAKDVSEIHVFRGDRAIITTTPPLKRWSDLRAARLMSVELKTGQTTVRLIPQFQDPFNQGVIGSSQTPPPNPPPPPPFPGTGGAAPKAPPSIETRFSFRFDAKTTLNELLPKAPKSAKLPAPFNEDLTKVPEIELGEPLSKSLTKMEAMEKTAHLLAKANHLNRPKTDGFMEALIANRTDLHGLPFLMGAECRTREEQARVFAEVAEGISDLVRQAKAKAAGGDADAIDKMWMDMVAEVSSINVPNPGLEKNRFSRQDRDQFNRAIVAALAQILMPESALQRTNLARCLATIQHVDATKALARLVLFSPEEDVRAAAIDGLKLRRDQDYTQILLDGFRYPLPAVSKRAAEALVKLERKDLLPQLVDVLERADPRLPATEKRGGNDVTVVRELVKVNHHRNCMLCHAPGNTENTPEGILKIAVPLPTEPLPKPSQGGGYQSAPPPTPDILVRIDMTYLRQDFSLMLPVADAHPWPEMQRFDFLVRTRVLTANEAQAYEQTDEPGRLSPYHRAALFALRELSGRDTEPTAAAWRKLLKLPARQ